MNWWRFIFNQILKPTTRMQQQQQKSNKSISFMIIFCIICKALTRIPNSQTGRIINITQTWYKNKNEDKIAIFLVKQEFDYDGFYRGKRKKNRLFSLQCELINEHQSCKNYIFYISKYWVFLRKGIKLNETNKRHSDKWHIT